MAAAIMLGVVSASVSVSSKSTTRIPTESRAGTPGTALKKRTSSRMAFLYSVRKLPTTAHYHPWQTILYLTRPARLILVSQFTGLWWQTRLRCE